MIAIRSLDTGDASRTLAINAAATPAVAALDAVELARLMHLSDRHLAAASDAELLGYALLFRESDAYDGEEFATLRSLLGGASFLYVDQIAVQQERQGSGIGRRLYEAIADRGGADGVHWLCCEVNLLPPNPGSSAFHARLGFDSVGRLRTADGREVDLLAKPLAAASRHRATASPSGFHEIPTEP
jgi:hypothetical protein